MSHLSWDPTPAQGPAAMNLWGVMNHHKYPRGLGCDAEPLMLEKESWKLVTDNVTFLQHLLSALSHLQRKILRGTCKHPALTKSTRSSLLGRTQSRVLSTERQWVCQDFIPPCWQLCLIVSPCNHLLLVPYSQMAELLWSSPPPPLMLTQHLPAARDAASRAGTLSVTVE